MKTMLARLFIALAWLALPMPGQAQFTFTTNNGAITITGYNAAAGLYAVIPAMTNGYAVTGIGVYAFRYSGITNVVIPNSVTNIGDAALANCPSLASINVDAANPAFSSLGGVLFDKAQATLLQFPGGLGGSYTIPNSVISIGEDAFDGCYQMTSVTIPGSVTSIGNLAFIGCTGLTSVTIPGSVTNMGQNAFEQCESLTSVTLGSGVTSTGDYAFVLCSSLASVTIPNSVTNLGTNSFYGCGLTNVIIPDSVTSIAEGAFGDCTSLTNIAVDAANPAYSSLGGVLFDKAQATLLQSPGGLDGSYIIPNSVTSIGQAAFAYCGSLTSVTIPNSVVSIGDAAFVFSSLTNVTIPGSVTSIGADAFGETSLTSVTIPNSVTNLGTFAFADTLLATVYFQGNAPPDDGTVFADDLAIVYYQSGTTGWSNTFGDVPAVLWNPQATAINVSGGQFGFGIIGPSNAVIVVEGCTDLAHPVWLPISTNTLSGLGEFAFSDPQSSNYPARYYRFQSPFQAAPAYTVSGTLTGLPAGDTVTLQDNGGDDLTLSNNGMFTFPMALPDGQAYSVTVSGTGEGGSIQTAIYRPVIANGSGTISGANITNIGVQCTRIYTGNKDLDMYNAAVADGTANGGVPGVMLTQNGGPFRVTAMGRSSYNVARIYPGWAVFTQVAGSTSCSSTTFPTGTPVIQFGSGLECGFGPYGY